MVTFATLMIFSMTRCHTGVKERPVANIARRSAPRIVTSMSRNPAVQKRTEEGASPLVLESCSRGLPFVNLEHVLNTSVSQSLGEQCRTDSNVRKLFLLPVIEKYSPEFQKVLFVITDTFSPASLPQESPISHDLASVRKSSDTLANTLLL
jgi:hypothetical protein